MNALLERATSLASVSADQGVARLPRMLASERPILGPLTPLSHPCSRSPIVEMYSRTASTSRTSESLDITLDDASRPRANSAAANRTDVSTQSRETALLIS